MTEAYEGYQGHTHIRDCVQLDGRSMSLESGRYMETVGRTLSVGCVLAAKLDGYNSTKNDGSKPEDIKFSRRYLDPNRVTYEYHTRKEETEFDTKSGESITAGLKALAAAFNLDFLFGTAPHDYTISRNHYPSEGSSLSLYAAEAAPAVLAINNSRASIPNLIIFNSGIQRFDIYAGPFTRNDQLTASPFVDKFLYIPGIKLSLANAVLASLNNPGAGTRRSLTEEREATEYGLGNIDRRYKQWLRGMDRRHGAEKRTAQNLTLGYVTNDSCPGMGDDTLHAPMPFFDVPDFISSNSPAVSDDTPIDLVFLDFIGSQLIQILNTLQREKVYTMADADLYTSVLTNEVLGIYAQSAWN
ncbi:hypothetical protein C0992_003402 [Termitomyces sp. T32_za158]|nr:hypothetical protein C0992_003402 [Termitomyces sp. T32_za158]